MGDRSRHTPRSDGDYVEGSRSCGGKRWFWAVAAVSKAAPRQKSGGSDSDSVSATGPLVEIKGSVAVASGAVAHAQPPPPPPPPMQHHPAGASAAPTAAAETVPKKSHISSSPPLNYRDLERHAGQSLEDIGDRAHEKLQEMEWTVKQLNKDRETLDKDHKVEQVETETVFAQKTIKRHREDIKELS